MGFLKSRVLRMSLKSSRHFSETHKLSSAEDKWAPFALCSWEQAAVTNHHRGGIVWPYVCIYGYTGTQKSLEGYMLNHYFCLLQDGGDYGGLLHQWAFQGFLLGTQIIYVHF